MEELSGYKPLNLNSIVNWSTTVLVPLTIPNIGCPNSEILLFALGPGVGFTKLLSNFLVDYSRGGTLHQTDEVFSRKPYVFKAPPP